jgi:arabinose-5-phosphate isomerase
VKSEPKLDLVGIGSMVVDRLHRTARIVAADEKGPLLPFPGSGPVQRFVGGVMLNQLGWAAALGLRAGIFGKQADDDGGRFLRAAMDRLGIEQDLVLDGTASSLAEIFIDEGGERAIYMASAATGETTALHVRRHHADFIRRGAQLSTEVSQLPLDATLEALAIAREAGIATVLDLDVPPSQAVPHLGSEELLLAVLRAADLLKPSKAASAELVPDAKGDALELARGLRTRFGVRSVVVTDGERGCAVVTEGFEGWIPALPVKTVDTTGAGDAFLAGLLVARHRGLGWEEAGRLGNACGAACVERLGAFPEEPVRARERVLELYGRPLELGPFRVEAGGAGAASTRESVESPRGRRGHGSHESLDTIDVVLEELDALRSRTGHEPFDTVLALIRGAEAGGGRVHVTGVGKASHVARYAAALLSSTGTPSSFLDPVEAVHGASGQVVRGDVVIAVSNSGETEELTATISLVRALGARVVAVTGAPGSWLGRHAEVILDSGVAREGGGLGLAPRASFVAQTLLLGALAATLERASGFERAEYLARHPGGSLGKRLRDE